MSDLHTARLYITSAAKDDDLDVLTTAIKARRDLLGTLRIASLSVGAAVRLTELSPVVLNGLTGVITERIESRGRPRMSVRLDEASTRILISARYPHVSRETMNHELNGVPALCLRPFQETKTPESPQPGAAHG